MKKALLFIGLALCTSFAFAQTNNYNAKMMKNDGFSKIEAGVPGAKPADYKASIFAKDAYDTIKVWHFSSESATEDMPLVYGNNGRVGANEIVNGNDTLTPNAQTNDCATWRYVPDSNWFTGTFFLQNYNSFYAAYISNLNYYFGNGQYMLIHFGGLPTTSGTPHAYMTFAPVQRPADASVINIAFRQFTRKYYNTYFIDYKINGQWRSREVNIDGIDAEINSYCSIERNYAMPVILASEANIEIRVRACGSTRGNSYGNMWAIDNLAILYGDPTSWTGYVQDFVDGAYGTIPQGMNIPLTWISDISNTGANTLNNIQAVATHILNGDTTVVLSNDNGTMAAGDPLATKMVTIDERGFLSTDYPGWFGEGMAGAYGDLTNSSSFGQHRYLPTTNLGLNKMQVKVTATGAKDLKWPAIPYRVVGNTYGIAGLNDGYRWGHDNGVITTSTNPNYPYLSSYIQGYILWTDGNTYITDSGHFGDVGYRMTIRYNTPSVVPVDDNGEPWVLRGIEIIPSSWFSSIDMNGVNIIPVVYQDEYSEGGSVSFTTVNTGINGNAFRVDGSLNNEMTYGYKIANEEGNYNAVNYFFPEQPELTPNTSFRLGYIMASTGKFAVAATRNSTLLNTDSGAYSMPLDSIAGTAGYGRNFSPNGYDMYVYDPVGSSGFWGGFYDDSYPMIRAIVGPRIPLPRYNVSVDCNNGDATITYIDDTVCQADLEVAEGGSPSLYIYAGNDHSVLDKLYIDGQEVVSATIDEENGDYNFYTEVGGDNVDSTINGVPYVLLQRDYWVYTFSDIAANHTIRATSVPAEWDIAVDPVAVDVKMTLAPNPATSQVAMSLSGVTGMVNCSIIDMSGRVVYSKVINAEHNTNIDLSNVPAGAYFVRINNDSFVKVEKLIVR